MWEASVSQSLLYDSGLLSFSSVKLISSCSPIVSPLYLPRMQDLRACWWTRLFKETLRTGLTQQPEPHSFSTERPHKAEGGSKTLDIKLWDKGRLYRVTIYGGFEVSSQTLSPPVKSARFHLSMWRGRSVCKDIVVISMGVLIVAQEGKHM